MMQRKIMIMSYVGIVIGLLIAAGGAYLHFAIPYHERAYAVFFLGIVCMLAVVVHYLWKQRQYISSRLLRMASYGLGAGAALVTIASFFLLRSHIYLGTTALISLGGACLLAVYTGVFVMLLVKLEQRTT
jgi:hypothetical protein